MASDAERVKELRERTGAGVLDCRTALQAAQNDLQAAIEYLRKKGLADAQKRASREAKEGVVHSYIHSGSKLGVLVANSPTPENFIAVAEATIGLILMLLKRIKHNEAKLRRGEWAQRQDRGEFLFGKTVGLVGLGRVGSHVARRLVNWDVRLLAADPYVPAAHAETLGATLVDLATLLGESDIVSLHASLTDETRGLIGEKELRRMKPTALLVNTARGEMADEEAVARALSEGWIAGAAIDAFVKEPLLATSPLRGVNPERLILTPHNVSHSEAGRRANLRLAFEQILAAGRGEAPAHCVNPEAIPRWRITR